MLNFKEMKLRLAPWVCFLLGGLLLILEILDKKRAVSIGDLYPGLSAIAAGLLLRGFLKYVDRQTADEKPSGQEEKQHGDAFSG
ncbi:MAG TPA: hypothetical protein VMG10_30465 [Gemmataceae bacterium]|nr:hypothetical protein [Gemmataceae bacterium]